MGLEELQWERMNSFVRSTVSLINKSDLLVGYHLQEDKYHGKIIPHRAEIKKGCPDEPIILSTGSSFEYLLNELQTFTYDSIMKKSKPRLSLRVKLLKRKPYQELVQDKNDLLSGYCDVHNLLIDRESKIEDFQKENEGLIRDCSDLGRRLGKIVSILGEE
ncbi:MAG: hypothetical protein ABIH72_04820 [archaeon]